MKRPTKSTKRTVDENGDHDKGTNDDANQELVLAAKEKERLQYVSLSVCVSHSLDLSSFVHSFVASVEMKKRERKRELELNNANFCHHKRQCSVENQHPTNQEPHSEIASLSGARPSAACSLQPAACATRVR